jgi:hypothetical protein
MMMAHDSSPGPVSLADETIEAVRSALVAYVDAPNNGERLRQALHAMAAEARTTSMFPERLLILLKDIWYGLPAVRSLKDSNEQVRLLQRVVSICIREYYAD